MWWVMVFALAVLPRQDWHFEERAYLQEQPAREWQMEPEQPEQRVGSGMPDYPGYTQEICQRAVKERRRLLVYAGGIGAGVVQAAAAARSAGWLFAWHGNADKLFAGGEGIYVLVPVDDMLFVERERAELAVVDSGPQCHFCELAKSLLSELGVPWVERHLDDGKPIPRVNYRGKVVDGYRPEVIRALAAKK